MYFSLQQQLLVLWRSFLLGILIGIIFDVFCLWRRFCASRASVFARDFLFVSGVVLLSSVFYLHNSWGQIRWFYILSQCAGAVLFHKLIGRWLLNPIHAILSFVFRWICRLMRAVFSPIFRLLGLVFTGIQKLFHIIFKKLFIFINKYIIIILSSLKRRKTKEREVTNGTKFYH